MTRLLALVALAIILWMFLKIGWARLKRALAGEPARSPEIPLLRCSGCGVHVPRGRVVGGLCEECSPSRTTADDHGRSRTMTDP